MVKKVVSPPRISRPNEERRSVTSKYRSTPFFGRTFGPGLRRGAVVTVAVPCGVAAGAPTAVLPVPLPGVRAGRDLSGIGRPLGAAADAAPAGRRSRGA